MSYLGMCFLPPDPQKVAAVSDWATPASIKEVCKFIGLASNYCRYIQGFSNITKPLHNLTRKQTQFSWIDECDNAFNVLKNKLAQAPVLAYPQFSLKSPVFVLQNDASSSGVGAALEQGSCVIAYVSRTLNQVEQQCSVIQKECLAIVFALKLFRQYVLGRPFELLIDHAPLHWLSSQQMEGLLC